MSRLSNSPHATGDSNGPAQPAIVVNNRLANGRDALGSRRATWLSAAVIALAALAVYANSFNGAFVFDDIPWILLDPGVHKLWPLSDVLFSSNPNFVSGRPVVNLTIAVNYVLGGTDPRGYHAVNIAIHILAGLTLFGIVRRTLAMPLLRGRIAAAAIPLALAVALVWIVHPLQTAAVTYVIQRTEALVGLFYLLTLYCVIRGAESGHSWHWYAAAVVACFLGMGTKEVMVTAPVVVLLYDRTFLSGSFKAAVVRRWGLYLAMTATWGVVAWTLVSTGFHTGSAGSGAGGFTPIAYAMTQPGVIVHYLKLAIWPSGMSLDYGWPVADSLSDIVLPAIVVAMLAGLAIWGLVKNSPLGFLGAWFFVILAPTSSFVPIKDAAFDHRMYLPLAAVVSLVVIGGYVLWSKLAPRRVGATGTPRCWTVPYFLLGAAVVGLGCATVARNAVFNSAADVWRDVLEKDPDRPRPHNNLAATLIAEGKFDEAIEHCRIALALTPGYADAENNIGRALFLQGKTDEAIPWFERALQDYRNHPNALINLAEALVAKKETAKAINLFQVYLEIDPDNVKAHYDLAACLRDQGNPDAAIEQLHMVLALDPNHADAHNDLAALLAGQRRTAEAVAHFQQALSLKPDLPSAHFNLGIILWQEGKVLEAEKRWREAVRLSPKDVEYASKLAYVLATNADPAARNGHEAVELAKRAVELSQSKPDPNIVAILAAAYAEAGDFPSAVTTSHTARDMAIKQQQDSLAEQLRDRIKLYESRQPFHEAPR
jgi:Tfp pilus assembly protein PilF